MISSNLNTYSLMNGNLFSHYTLPILLLQYVFGYKRYDFSHDLLNNQSITKNDGYTKPSPTGEG